MDVALGAKPALIKSHAESPSHPSALHESRDAKFSVFNLTPPRYYTSVADLCARSEGKAIDVRRSKRGVVTGGIMVFESAQEQRSEFQFQLEQSNKPPTPPYATVAVAIRFHVGGGKHTGIDLSFGSSTSPSPPTRAPTTPARSPAARKAWRARAFPLDDHDEPEDELWGARQRGPGHGRDAGGQLRKNASRTSQSVLKQEKTTGKRKGAVSVGSASGGGGGVDGIGEND
ncbi:hypothetical protein C8J57DRAFT_1632141 [Mycena rebaudengoi]|nr:hypothetical protein C8J57DRAFT_1632141 [Mycena rebaudengoi]